LQHFTVLGNHLMRYAAASDALEKYVVSATMLDETARATLLHQLTHFEERMAGVVQEMNLSEQAAAPTVDKVAMAQTITSSSIGRYNA
jgi:hypothetical protein